MISMQIRSHRSPAPVLIAATEDGDPRSSSSFSGSRRAHQSRRYLLASSLAGAFLVAISVDKPSPEKVPQSPLIERLLERTRVNKAKNDQERLDNYYERNFKEYFEFVEGTIKNKTELTETERGILKWLDKTRNKTK